MIFGVLAMLFIACSEHTETQQKEVAVTFIPTLPVDISFRGVADGMTANRLYYAIYEQGSNEAISSNLGEPMPFSESTILTLPLISGFIYDIVFWVQAERAPYTFHPEAGYVAIDWNNHLTGNDEQRDAFIFVRKGYQVNQSGTPERIELKRPFAQLNIGISDYDAAAALGFDLHETQLSTQSYTRLDFFGGDEYGAPAGTLTDITFDWATPHSGADATIEVKGNTYKYIASAYLLPATPQGDVNVSLKFRNLAHDKYVGTEPFTAVTMERNHATNIMGSLLTSYDATSGNRVVNYIPVP